MKFSGKQPGPQRSYRDPVPFAPVQGHKEQNQSGAPLPKRYRTEDPGRKEGVLQDPQHHITLQNDYYSLERVSSCTSKVQSAYMSPSSRDKETKKMQLAFDQPASQHTTCDRHELTAPRAACCTPGIELWGQLLTCILANCSMSTHWNCWWERILRAQSCCLLSRETLGEIFSMIYPVSWTVSIHVKHRPCSENNTGKQTT